jgi:hypothetical protein
VTEGVPYDEQLPWLQPVDDEDEPRGVSARKMLAALAVVLVAALVVAATFFWIGRQDAATNGAPELIKAPPGPYKVKPANPGGLDISSESETAFETSAGQDVNAQLDTSKMAQPPVAKAQEPPKTLPTNETKAPVAPEAKAPAAPEVQPTGGAGSVIQLGAFANRTQAERAWTALSARFPAVAAMSKMIVPFPGGIRLRAGAASQAEAKQACDAVKAGGENCFVAK